MIRIWTEASHHPGFRCGGWAYVRVVDGERSGMAGGARGATAARMELAGLAAALQGLPNSAAELVIHTANPRLARLGGLIAGQPAGEDPPAEDLDLWAAILTGAAGHGVRVRKVAAAPKTPAAFAAAWAEAARDKAKMQGAFSAAIPKLNLTKMLGLEV